MYEMHPALFLKTGCYKPEGDEQGGQVRVWRREAEREQRVDFLAREQVDPARAPAKNPARFR
jgi:hypothetical protein